MGRPTSLCLFCGSNVGDNPAFTEAADHLGAEMAHRNVQLVYGGGHVGIMGVAAEAVMREGGRVVGFIPEHLNSPGSRLSCSDGTACGEEHARAQTRHVRPRRRIRGLSRRLRHNG